MIIYYDDNFDNEIQMSWVDKYFLTINFQIY